MHCLIKIQVSIQKMQIVRKAILPNWLTQKYSAYLVGKTIAIYSSIYKGELVRRWYIYLCGHLSTKLLIGLTGWQPRTHFWGAAFVRGDVEEQWSSYVVASNILLTTTYGPSSVIRPSKCRTTTVSLTISRPRKKDLLDNVRPTSTTYVVNKH